MEMIHYHFETLTSTNEWAKKQLSTFSRDQLILVTADEQTDGRGQYGREWISPKEENLYASFCFFIDEQRHDPLALTHVLAITLAHVLEKKGIIVHIKWPNDLLVNQKKIAGILCETQHLSPYFGIVIGVGLNINMPEETLKTIGQPATSLRYETHKEWELPMLLQEIQTDFLNNLKRFLCEGFTPFLPDLRTRILPELKL